MDAYIIRCFIKSLKESHSKLLVEHENLDKNLADQSNKLDNLKSSETVLQNHIKDTTTALSTVNLPAATPVATNLTDMVKEYLDREQWKSNLIVYGIPEPASFSTDEQKSSDITYFTELVNSEDTTDMLINLST